MNQISRICVCRSLLRFARWASKPISSPSSLISNDPTSSNLVRTIISKSHHTFNYHPAQIFSSRGNQFRKCSGEPAAAAAECNMDVDDLEDDIHELHEEINEARDHIELCSLPPLDAALLINFGLENVKYRDYLPHLQRFRKKIKHVKVCVHETVAFGL
ncbi:hypothetical protein MKW94_027984, partial [Papaver nudicaule]|nr:hypothetical protein [Papaver nudicaule]